MKMLQKNFFAISLLLTGSLFAGGNSEIQALRENSHIVLVPKSVSGVKIDQTGKATEAKPVVPVAASIQTTATPTPQVETEPKEQKFSFTAGIKKGVNYIVSPIAAYPWISALVACLSLGYAHKQGYLQQLLVKLGLQKDEESKNAVVPVVNE